MAVNPKSLENLKVFEKGKSGNPNGRPREHSEIRKLKETTKSEVVEAIHRSMLMNLKELELTLKDPTATIAQQLVGRIIMKALKEGCYQRAQFLLNYVIGRPAQFVDGDQSGPDLTAPSPQAILTGVPTNVLVELMTKYKQQQEVDGTGG